MKFPVTPMCQKLCWIGCSEGKLEARRGLTRKLGKAVLPVDVIPEERATGFHTKF